MLSRLLIGAALHRLRVSQGLSFQDAGAAISAPAGLVSMAEHGKVALRIRDIIDLCTLYGVGDIGYLAALLGLAQQARRDEWWQAYLDVIPAWFERYLGLEQAATLIRSYHPQLIPGLLQTRHYIRAVLALNRGQLTPHDIGRRAALRIRRQDVLHRPQPARLWAVIDETALRRPAGSRAVMRAQLQHLLDACDMPNITIQILTFSTGAHPAASGAITLLRMPDEQLNDVIYLEQLDMATYLNTPDQTHPYQHALDQLAVQATPSGKTTDLLTQILRQT